MAKNQKKITLASFNYLMEFSALPKETRQEYLQLLLRRKNASSQKNVLLLKIIYRYVDENIIYQWNPEYICKTLDISADTLYKHKSRLLNGLKKYFCQWKDSDRETGVMVNYSESENSKGEKYFRIHLDLALNMYTVGLKKEAVIKLLNLEKQILKSSVDIKFKNLTLTQIYERAAIYYTVRENRSKVLFYFNKLKSVCEDAANLDLSEKEQTLINIRLNYGEFFRDYTKFHKKHYASKINFYLNNIYNDSIKINAKEYILKSLHNMAIIADMLKNTKKAKQHCLKGYQLSVKFNEETPKNTFAALLYNIEYKADRKSSITLAKKLLEYYYHIKKVNPLDQWTIYLESFCAGICLSENMQESDELMRSTANSNILFGDYSYAVYLLFKLDSENYHNKFVSLFAADNNGLYLGKVNPELLSSAENTCLTTLHYNKAINDMGFIWEVYMLRLVALFFREHDFDYESAMLTANKMDWLIKNKRKVSALSSFELLKLGIKMIEGADNPKHMLARYEFKLKKAIDDFKSSPPEISIMDYAIASSLARRLNIKSITAIVKDFYNWLQTNHPAILAPVFRELDEKKSKVYTVEGTEAAA